MSYKYLRVWKAVFPILLLYASIVFAVPPSYMPVSSSYESYTTGVAEVYSIPYGLDYGKAKIEWHYWFNSANNYWYYAYRVYNNEAGVLDDRTDDYHFGHTYDSGSFTPINLFDVVFGVLIPKVTGEEVVVLDSTGGSSKGGGPWGSQPKIYIDIVEGKEYFKAIDWSTTLGGAGAYTIDPTQWDYQRISGKWYWVKLYSGDTSRNDAADWQYFEIASTWAPGTVNAHVSTGLVSSDTVLGVIYGPKVMPASPTTRTLTSSSTDGGNVTTPGEGAFTYDNETVVDIVATADVGYHFVNWTGTAVTAGKVTDPNAASTTVLMDADYAVQANFAIDQMAIFGYVTEPDANAPVESVFVEADNGGGSDTTDANGYYEFTVTYGWSGTVTLSKEGYSFDPNGMAYSDVTTNLTDDYTAYMDVFYISGYAVDSQTLQPLSGVLITPDNDGGPFTSKYYGGSDTTDANGYYEVIVDYNWSGNVVPSKYAYAFQPNSITYTNVTADITETQYYVGTLLTYKIAGYIKNACEVPIEGVVVDANNGGNSDTTDANGYYEVWVDYNWSGTVTPSKTLYTFDPNSKMYAAVLEDKTGQDYTADNIYDLDCDGLIGYGDVAVIGENWLQTSPGILGDFDEDETVNFLDFAEFATVW